MRVAVACATHKGSAANHKAFRKFGDYFFTAEAILRGEDSPATEQMRHRSDGFDCLRGFAGNNSEIKLRQLFGVRCSAKIGVKFMLARNAQTMFLESQGMFGAPNKGVHFGDAGQMDRVEAADGAASDDADSLCHEVQVRTAVKAALAHAKEAMR
jgi:hypothetical protein